MQKVCVIYSFKPSNWVSCQKIVSNLLKSYEMHSDYELIPVSYADGMSDYEAWESVKTIVDARPTHIILLDHFPHCVHILDPLLRVLPESSLRPHFIFHIYGDFTLYFAKWRRVEEILKGYDVLWYAASARQRAMLGEFIPLEQIEICPFPVDAKEFYPDTNLRQKFRKEKNWRDDETIFIFTGRLSRQKRIHQLIRTFVEWRQASQANAKLVLVGDCDKHGEPYLLRGEYEGEYFHYLLSVLNTIPADERARIEVHGFKPNKQLNAYYNAADVLVNISVHNDEDYGMSCAEALAAGLPLILTDWAGFSSFRRPGLEQAIRMVPVKIARKGKLISLKSLSKAFQDMYDSCRQFSRQDIAEASLKYTGIQYAAQVIKKGLSQQYKFVSFSPTFKEAYRLELYQRRNTFADIKTRTFNDLYMKVYRHYVE